MDSYDLGFFDEIIPPGCTRPMYYDKQLQPITMRQFGELKFGVTLIEPGPETPNGGVASMFTEYAVIGQDTIGEANISTVWLGIDHGWGGFDDDGDEEYRPIVFETMIFGGEYDQMCRRYYTEDEAKKAHDEAVLDLRAGMKPWWALGGEEYDEWVSDGT